MNAAQVEISQGTDLPNGPASHRPREKLEMREWLE